MGSSSGSTVPSRVAGRGLRIFGAISVIALLALLIFLRQPSARATDPPPPPGSETCLDCHEIGVPARDRVPGEPPRIDAAALASSPHAEVECVACHSDLEGVELPHPEKLQPVQCSNCHDDVEGQYDLSLHGRAVKRGDPLAPRCTTCHGSHDIRRSKDPLSRTTTMNIPALCGGCHREGSPVQLYRAIPQDSILTNYSESIHGEGLYKKGLVVSAVCTSCHTAHQVLPHTDPTSSISRERIAGTCQQCHAQIERVHRKVIRGELWEKQPHLIPACVDCHSPHKARKVFYTQGMADRDCMSCHEKTDLVSQSGIPSARLHVSADSLSHSRHSRVACVQCHTECSPSLDRPCTTVAPKVDCSICHAAVVDVYKKSTHGKLAAAESPDAPTCRDCHGDHGILGRSDSASPIFPRNVPTLCGQCHRAGQKAAVRYQGDQQGMVEHYAESIHGKGLLESGLTVTATCANCHTAHGELPANDPESTVNPENVAKTCAQCHRGIYEQYANSVHSETVTKTKEKLPTCADCHSAHEIQRTDESDFKLSIMNQCGKCHGEIASTYFETYHGKVSKLGYVKTARCDDCHGAHNILPPWTPKSTLSRENIVKTCAQCHPGSNRRFAGYLTHATHHDAKKYPFLFYTFWGMTGLLVGTLTFAGIHTLLWLPRSLQYRKQVKAAEAHGSTQYVRRFKPFYSRLHLMVIVSFLGLALTGMTLKFSYAQWAHVLARFFGGFEAAGFIHRVCAVITFSYFALHLWDLLTRKRREAGGMKKLILGVNSMLPSLTDLKEVGGSIRWFLGRGPRPDYGRWTYWEKFDYFAVFWGVAMIGLTGLLLWFPEFFTRFIPGQALNVATIIHSDEALLAVGFIFTIHFFNTHFRPEKFPMDPVIFTGSVPLEELKIDRPREYEELVKSGKLEEHLVDPPSPQALKIWRIFGFTALTIGLSVVAMIIYAMLFAYR
ncbi:MAG: cytochrome c3 family protein [Candidatus Eisenbacteria bacterium]